MCGHGQRDNDFVRLYQAARNRNIGQQQLGDAKARLLAQFEAQTAEIRNLQDRVKKSQAFSDFFTLNRQ